MRTNTVGAISVQMTRIYTRACIRRDQTASCQPDISFRARSTQQATKKHATNVHATKDHGTAKTAATDICSTTAIPISAAITAISVTAATLSLLLPQPAMQPATAVTAANSTSGVMRWCNVDGQNVACYNVKCHLRRVLLGKALTSRVIYVALYVKF